MEDGICFQVTYRALDSVTRLGASLDDSQLSDLYETYRMVVVKCEDTSQAVKPRLGEDQSFQDIDLPSGLRECMGGCQATERSTHNSSTRFGCHLQSGHGCHENDKDCDLVLNVLWMGALGGHHMIAEDVVLLLLVM